MKRRTITSCWHEPRNVSRSSCECLRLSHMQLNNNGDLRNECGFGIKKKSDLHSFSQILHLHIRAIEENGSSQLTRNVTNESKRAGGKQPEIDVGHGAPADFLLCSRQRAPVIPARDNGIRRLSRPVGRGISWNAKSTSAKRPDAEVRNRRAAEFPIGNVGQNLTLNSPGECVPPLTSKDKAMNALSSVTVKRKQRKR